MGRCADGLFLSACLLEPAWLILEGPGWESDRSKSEQHESLERLKCLASYWGGPVGSAKVWQCKVGYLSKLAWMISARPECSCSDCSPAGD